MRTTLTLEPDAFRAAKAKAAHENISLGRAVSDLILAALRVEEPPASSGQGVFRSPGGLYTSSEVEEGLDDE